MERLKENAKLATLQFTIYLDFRISRLASLIPDT